MATTIYCPRCKQQREFRYREGERGATKHCWVCGRRLSWFPPKKEGAR